MNGRYLSVCSGIEVAALAWVPLGWHPVLVSEIEAFPREVLRLRHGARDVRRSRPSDSLALWGDFTALRMRHLRRLGIDPADINVLVGGTPCQGFSVAGLRGSLSDPRGGLSLAFLRLAHAIQSVRSRAGKRGLVVVWENVPGVLNTPDNALGCFLGALVGADDALRSPLERGRWPSAGMVSGPRARAAWRVLDAQHFGLPQRRERVFLVGSFGDGADPAEILFEPESLHGDPAQGGEATKEVAGTLTASLGGVSGKDDIASRVVAGTITSHAARARGAGLNPEGLVAGKLRSHTRPGSNDLGSVVAFDCKAGGETGFSIGALPGALRGEGHGGGHAAVAYGISSDTFDRSGEGASGSAAERSGLGITEELSPTLKAKGPNGVAHSFGVRRLMPIECERLQGVPDNFTRIPWRGQPAEMCPDGPRYRALGNAYPRPVLAWIGRRIVDAIGAEMREAAE